MAAKSIWLTPVGVGSDVLEKLVADVRAHGGETVDLNIGNAPEINDFAAWVKIFRLLRFKPDLVHAHSSKAGALARIAALLYPGFPPVVYSPHGYYGLSHRGGLKEKFFNVIESVLGRVGTTHLVSDYEYQFAADSLHIPKQSMVLIYPGVNTGRFAPASEESKLECRRELGLPLKTKLLVALGRNSFEKNFDALYAVLGEILPKADWHFAHAGGSAAELKATLPPDAQSRVTTFEFLHCPEKLLAAADGVIIPSRNEAFGLVAYEAFSCGLPLIVTATTGLLSLKRTEVSGIRWLPDPRHQADIRPEIKTAIIDWADAPHFDPASQRKLACEWFDETTQLEKMAALYQEVASQ